jgi:PAS domain S-box-containing protein
MGVAFTWTAYREMRHALRIAGEERVGNAAAPLADLLVQTAAARVAEIKRLASDSTIRRFVLTGDGLEGALLALRAAAQRNPQGSIRLTTRGETLETRVIRGQTIVERTPEAVRSVESESLEGVGPLRVEDGHVWYSTRARVVPSLGELGTGTAVVSIERPLTASSGVALIQRLIGSGAMLKLGNAADDVWTDLSVPVASPPALAPGTNTVSFADAGGTRHLGTALPIIGTPWQLWVEFAEAPLMRPAATLLRRMVPWTTALILLGVLTVGVVSARITTPLQRLVEAADTIASGDYTRRVTATGVDEVGRLGAAFNVMASHLAESRDALEARVAARSEELSETREEMNQFFSMSPDLLCIADVKGQFTRVNHAWTDVLGWSQAELTTVRYATLVHPDDVAETDRESAKLANGGGTVNFENRYRTKGGDYRWLSWKAIASPARGRVYAAARDVTDARRAARELQQYAAELSASNHELESFSYSVSHDLRAPLRSIDGFSQALLEDCGDRLGAEGEGYLRRIRNAAQHMGRLIDDLLKLARVTRADLHFEPVDLSAIARTAFAALREAHADRAVDCHVQPGLRATGDPRLLQIAMTNLIENAWKFTSKRSHAEIEFGAVDENGRAPEYFVRDNGAGFDAAYATKLFGAFQRLHQPADFPGTGIGLATVQRIVTRHGGRVRAEGVVDRGATFSFTLKPGESQYESSVHRAS